GVHRIAAHARLTVFLAAHHRTVILFAERVDLPPLDIPLRRRRVEHAAGAVSGDPLAVIAPSDVQVRGEAHAALARRVAYRVAFLDVLAFHDGTSLARQVQVQDRPAGALEAIAVEVEDDEPVLGARYHTVRDGARPAREVPRLVVVEREAELRLRRGRRDQRLDGEAPRVAKQVNVRLEDARVF